MTRDTEDEAATTLERYARSPLRFAVESTYA